MVGILPFHLLALFIKCVVLSWQCEQIVIELIPVYMVDHIHQAILTTATRMKYELSASIVGLIHIAIQVTLAS